VACTLPGTGACNESVLSYHPLQGASWSAANLGSGDPRHFQYALHETDSFPEVGGWAVSVEELQRDVHDAR